MTVNLTRQMSCKVIRIEQTGFLSTTGLCAKFVLGISFPVKVITLDMVGRLTTFQGLTTTLPPAIQQC